jgi:dephospho-CoA kinase
MKVIGLTGSIAMGKSEVAKVFREHGIPVFDSDSEVHALYDSKHGGDLLKADAPEAIVDGCIDRKILSALVASDASLLSRLEKKVHAEIRLRRNGFLEQARAQGAKLAVVDVPLLFETGADKDVDITLVVSSSLANQKARVFARFGMTQERFDVILARQMPDVEKRKRADHVIDNNGSLVELQTKVQNLIYKLQHENH